MEDKSCATCKFFYKKMSCCDWVMHHLPMPEWVGPFANVRAKYDGKNCEAFVKAPDKEEDYVDKSWGLYR